MADRRTIFLAILAFMLAYGTFRVWMGWSDSHDYAAHAVSTLQGAAVALFLHWNHSR